MNTVRQLATFRVQDLSLGLNVLEVQEVLRDQPLTPVPLAPESVAGLINLRGQIVPAISLERLLRLPVRASGAAPVSLVVATAAGQVSLQADDVGDVIEVGADSFEPPPRNLDPGVSSLISGIHKLDGHLLLVLDTARLLAVQCGDGSAANER